MPEFTGRPPRGKVPQDFLKQSIRSHTRYLPWLLGALVVAGLTVLAYWIFTAPERGLRRPLTVSGKPASLVVMPGMNLGDVTRELAARDLLANPRELVQVARQQQVGDKIRAGEYFIEPGTTPLELLDKLVGGQGIQRAMTIVEGWNFRQLLAAIEENEYFDHALTGRGFDEIMTLMGRSGVHPEGRFYPDTYHFPRGTTDMNFLERAFDTMEKRLLEAWDQREKGLPYDSPLEALVLASIVEKETAAPEERTRIAGVFVRRLKRRMRLESDPTVIYGMGEAYRGDIKRSDLRRDTPYNTYVRRGLPPTPIAMPGMDAINAALHPDKGKAVFFVAKGDGRHHFSATYDEHKRAVAKYQLHGRVASQ